MSRRISDRGKHWLAARVAPNGPIKLMIGLSVAPDDANSVADLLKIADPRHRSSDTPADAA